MSALDEKLFSLVDDEIPEIKADAALAQATRSRYQDLSASYNAMNDLYPNTQQPADRYASQVHNLRAKYVRLVDALQKDLKIDVPPMILTLLKASASDGQSQTIVTQIVPAPVQSRRPPQPRPAVAAARGRVAVGRRHKPRPGRPPADAEPARPRGVGPAGTIESVRNGFFGPRRGRPN